MNNFILVECSDWNQVYGIIKTDMSDNDLQEEIYKIKNNMDGKGFVDWTIENIIEKLNDRGFNAIYTSITKKIEI